MSTVIFRGDYQSVPYQFAGLIADGKEVILNKGDVGYVKAGRIHDAKYLQDCQLVYVHDHAFGFKAEHSHAG